MEGIERYGDTKVIIRNRLRRINREPMKSVGVARNGRIDFVIAVRVRYYFFTILEKFAFGRVFRRYDGDIELCGKLFSVVSCGYGDLDRKSVV